MPVFLRDIYLVRKEENSKENIEQDGVGGGGYSPHQRPLFTASLSSPEDQLPAMTQAMETAGPLSAVVSSVLFLSIYLLSSNRMDIFSEDAWY